jgi:endonuclease V-like protein UPF0215 family
VEEEMKKTVLITAIASLLIVTAGFVQAKEVPYTLEDRDRLIRVETKLTEMERRFESRFESIDKRFESIERQIDRQSIIFTALVVAVIGFAYWDRRTIIRKAKEETIAEIEKEGRLKDMIGALRDLSKTDEQVARVLKQFNLL